VLIKLISKSECIFTSYLDETNDVIMNSLNFELNAMNILKEENILKSIELIITEKNLYLVLEEPQGDSINKIVSKNGPLTERKLVNFVKKLRSTFKTLQKNDIIHG
jgi:serine/threonine protein kinase